MRRFSKASAILVLVLIAAACSDESPLSATDVPATDVPAPAVFDYQDAISRPATIRSPESQIAVTMTEFAFSPASIEVEAGETVRFVVTNEGVVEHEFRLTSTHEVAEHLASGHEGHDDTADMPMVTVQPGATKVLEWTFASDVSLNLVACLIPGHYEAGMSGDLHVEGLTGSADHDTEQATG